MKILYYNVCVSRMLDCLEHSINQETELASSDHEASRYCSVDIVTLHNEVDFAVGVYIYILICVH